MSELRHRGPDPEDLKWFGGRSMPVLREASADLCWLLNRGYAVASSSELVGNRYKLSARQRLAVARCACSDQARERRAASRLEPEGLSGRELWLDGFNVVLVLEAALGGGVVLVGRDECCRDVSGIHRRYNQVRETIPALQLAGRMMSGLGLRGTRWWLDSPIGNSGRLKKIILDLAAENRWAWEVELVANPDRVLCETTEVVVTADREILDQCPRWFNLVRRIVREQIPGAWLVDLSG